MSNFFVVIFFLASVVFLGALVVLARRMKLSNEISVAMIAATGAILTSVFTVSYTQYDSKLKEIKDAHRLQKIEVYSEFSDLVFLMLERFKETEGESENIEERSRMASETLASDDLVQKKFWSLNKKLILWGSPEVIKAWTEFKSTKNLSSNEESREVRLRRGLDAMVGMDNVFRAMREDLDLSNEGLERGDLLGVFVSDLDTLHEMLGD